MSRKFFSFISGKYTRAMLLVAGLAGASLALYLTHYRIFNDAHHIFLYLLGDIAFLPVDVLIVTFVLHRLLEARSRREKRHKLNMIIGAFYSEAGNELLAFCAGHDRDRDEAADIMTICGQFSRRQLRERKIRLSAHSYALELTANDFAELKTMLLEKRAFMLGLLENPVLMEHDTFADLLWAVFHLIEECAARKHFDAEQQHDLAHLTEDVRRAYRAVSRHWLGYMHHLSGDYPYLYSLALRMNPFSRQRCATID